MQRREGSRGGERSVSRGAVRKGNGERQGLRRKAVSALCPPAWSAPRTEHCDQPEPKYNLFCAGLGQTSQQSPAFQILLN